jgi:phage regulator Rha-like protein
MPKSAKMPIIPDELVINKIYLIRGQKIMLDFDLAKLYATEAKRLKEAVRRNKERFPEDFMFVLTEKEWVSLRTQIASLNSRGQHPKYKPFAFTEQGVSMLSSVLNSSTAISVNIQIIRVFTKMRALLLTHKDILLQLEKMERKMGKHDEQIALVFSYLKKLLNPPQPPRTRIGFRRKDEKN